jgi:hypothetical protein
MEIHQRQSAEGGKEKVEMEETMKIDKQRIDEFFNRFLQHSHSHQGDICVLDITKREVEDLGLFFVAALSEWSTGGTSPSFDPVASHKVPPIGEFIDTYMKKHVAAKLESADVLLKRFPEECQALGRHFASIFARWAEGFDRKREIARKRRPDLHARKTPRAKRRSQPLADLFAEFVSDQGVIVKGTRLLGIGLGAYEELGWRCLAVLTGWINNGGIDNAIRARYEPIATDREFEELGWGFVKVMTAWVEGIELIRRKIEGLPYSKPQWKRGPSRYYVRFMSKRRA